MQRGMPSSEPSREANEITGANVTGPCGLAIRMLWAASIARLATPNKIIRFATVGSSYFDLTQGSMTTR